MVGTFEMEAKLEWWLIAINQDEQWTVMFLRQQTNDCLVFTLKGHEGEITSPLKACVIFAFILWIQKTVVFVEWSSKAIKIDKTWRFKHTNPCPSL
jgi:hypothetical protein